MKTEKAHSPCRAGRLFLATAIALALWCAHVDARGGPLVVRGDDNYPPYEFQGEHGPDGFNVELFRAVAEAVGLEYDLRLGVWDEVRNDLENGRIDALTGMYYSRDRDRTVDFTAPHSIVTHSIFVRKGSTVHSLADLRGKEVIVQRGDIMHDFVRDFGFVVHVVPVTDQREALTLLASGRHDAALLSKLQGLYHVRKLGLMNIAAVGDPIMPRDYCFAVKEGDTRLASRLNEGLRIVRETGEYHQIHRRWFGGEAGISLGDFALYGAWAAGIGLFMLLLVLTWSWSLKSQVRQKTLDLERELEERRRVEAELRTGEERLRGVVQNMPVMMDAFDTEEVLVAWNAECERVTGYDADEMVGNPDAMRLLYPEPGRLGEIMEEFRRTGGRFRNWRLPLRCKDGSERIIEWSSITGDFPIPGWSAWSVGVDVTDRVRADEQVRRSLAEKEVLLKEIHHRVKNNLQIIHSLLNLQAGHGGGTTAEVFRDVQSRVMAMALIHEKLYKSADFIHIDYAAYLKALLRDLVRTYSQPSRVVSIRSDIDDIELTIDRAIPCGLVVTEIVSNSLKHAFPPGWEGEPLLRVALKSEKGSTVRLVIEDNGIGLPPGMREGGTGSLGMLLIGRLAEGQMGASLSVESNGGTRYEIVFSRE